MWQLQIQSKDVYKVTDERLRACSVAPMIRCPYHHVILRSMAAQQHAPSHKHQLEQRASTAIRTPQQLQTRRGVGGHSYWHSISDKRLHRRSREVERKLQDRQVALA